MNDHVLESTGSLSATEGSVDAINNWPVWPSYGLVNDLLPELNRWKVEGQHVALATLVHIEGSSPRPLGSEMAISDSGEIAGYVSGGCVEAAVAEQAGEVLATGQPVMLDYGAGSPVLDVQLTCGGRIGIFVRRIFDLDEYVDTLMQARERREALTVTIDLVDGTHSFELEKENESTFRQVYLPPIQLILIGSDPVTLALCQLAPLFGYIIGLVCPYGPKTKPPRTTLFYYDNRPLDRALNDLPLDQWSALYTLTHNMDEDHAIVIKALESPAFCIGVLGSRRKRDERLKRLRASGVDEESLNRLRTRAGVDIGGREPHEIALSILAEVVANRPRPEGF